jgi:hypothetical protein
VSRLDKIDEGILAKAEAFGGGHGNFGMLRAGEYIRTIGEDERTDGAYVRVGV